MLKHVSLQMLSTMWQYRSFGGPIVNDYVQITGMLKEKKNSDYSQFASFEILQIVAVEAKCQKEVLGLTLMCIDVIRNDQQ